MNSKRDELNQDLLRLQRLADWCSELRPELLDPIPDEQLRLYEHLEQLAGAAHAATQRLARHIHGKRSSLDLAERRAPAPGKPQSDPDWEAVPPRRCSCGAPCPGEEQWRGSSYYCDGCWAEIEPARRAWAEGRRARPAWEEGRG